MRLTLAVATLALTAGTALAQPAPPPGPPGGPPGLPPGTPPGAESRPTPPPGGPMMGGPMMGGPMMGHRGPGPGRHHGPPPPRGASFHFERGDASIGIRCPATETVRACVDASVVLLDRLLPAGQR